MPTHRIPSVERWLSATLFPLRNITVALTVLLGGGLIAPPAEAQIPGGRAVDRGTELYLRANRIYEYGRDSKDYPESQRALRTCIPMFLEFLQQAPRHEFAQKASYRLGMAHLLTGDLVQADATFLYVIRQYRTGHYVATAAYRIAAQRYNNKAWLEAAPYFATATREAEKNDLRHKAIYYEARCLILGKRPSDAIARLETIIRDPTNPFADYARLALGQLKAAAGKHEEALAQFELLLGPSTAPQERAQAMISAGESATKLGRTTLAETYLNRLLSTVGLDPKFKARAQLGLMEAHFHDKNYAAAIDILHQGEFSGDDHIMARVYMMAGRCLAKLGRYQEAPRYFFNVERLAPLSALGFEASYRRLVSFYHIDNPNLAAQCDGFQKIYGPAFANHQWLQQARLLKAESLFHQGSITSAATAYSEIDTSKISAELRGDLLFRRGWCLSESGDYNGATQSLTLFIEKYPDSPHLLEALAQRGKSFLELNRLNTALKDFERLLAADPPIELAAFSEQQCARIFHDQREYRKMIRRYEILLKDFGTLRQDTVANANYWIGWGWFKLEDWEKSIIHLEIARNLVPEFYEDPATTHLILAAYSAQDAPRLKEEVARFLKRSPGKHLPTKMLTWLGLQLFQRGDFSGADDALSLASDRDEPSNTDLIIWRHLTKARIELQHYDRATEAVKALLAREQKPFWRADALLDQSHIKMGQENWDQARASAHEGLALNPKGTVRAGLLMTLGDLAQQRADHDSAAANYLKVAELFIEDREIKPFALQRAAKALTQAGRPEEARQVQTQLAREFPGWKAPSQ